MSTPKGSTKQTYTTPRLSKLGPLAKLTHGGNGSKGENSKGKPGWKKP